MDRERRYGVITLGNDRVYDFLVALTRSLQRHSSLPLALIPFDQNMRRTAAFARRHGVTVLEPAELDELERLGARVWPGRSTAPRPFRKLAAFWSVFDHFLFVDADVVLLADPLPFIRAHEENAPDAFWCFDTNEGAAYRPGPLRDEMLRAGFPGVNTGLFIARRERVTIEQVRDAVESAGSVRDQFQDFAEQPLLNHLLQREQIPVETIGEVAPEFAGTTWAKARLREGDGGWILDEPTWPGHGSKMPALHWSGMAPGPLMPNRRIFLDYRAGGAPIGRAAHLARLTLVALGRLPRKVRSLLNVVRGRPLGAWR